MNLILALLLVGCFLVLCVFVYSDIVEECRFQLEVADDGPPRAENREVPQTTKGTGSS